MKARLGGMVLLALAGLAGAPGEEPELKHTWVDEADPQAAAILATGTRLTDVVGGSLMREVSRALGTLGLDDSMDVMHLKSLAIPPPVPGKPSPTGFKLTSYRIRNPRNAPDPADLAALDLIRDKLRTGDNSVNRPLLQKVTRAGQPDEWRIYRPFIVTPQCLYCHGRASSLQPQIRSALNRRFPEDQATDYGPHDWRGIIRVSLIIPPE